jgi:hypothetical protein
MVAVYGQQPFFVVEAPSAYVPPHPGPKQAGRVCTSLWQLQTIVLVTKPGWRQCTGWRPLEHRMAAPDCRSHRRLWCWQWEEQAATPIGVEARRWRWRPLERKKAAPVGARAREWRWWWPLEPQAAPPVGVQFRRRWRRPSMQTKAAPVEATAPIELPAAAPTSTWPAAYQRPAADRGGTLAARPLTWVAARRRSAADLGGAPAAHPSTWDAICHRSAADPGGVSASRPSSPAVTARCWWTRAMVWAAATAAVLAVALRPPI